MSYTYIIKDIMTIIINIASTGLLALIIIMAVLVSIAKLIWLLINKITTKYYWEEALVYGFD